jgi:dihydrodipicolinate synthase/N-acetylneuraminate lyase
VVLPRGIISVVQTPFDSANRVEPDSLRRLVQDAIEAGVAGLLLPVVASEVAALSDDERRLVVEVAREAIGERVPLIVGASTNDVGACRAYCVEAQRLEATAILIAVPQAMYTAPIDRLIRFLREATAGVDRPLLVQDLRFNDFGLSIEALVRLREALPTLVGYKIETLPAGPKFTLARQALGRDCFIAGGWAVPQLIEALDRGVDAMIPESSMVRVYTRIFELHDSGRRDEAVAMFRQLLPVLSFSNQEIGTSIAFFKRLLHRKGIFTSAAMRQPRFAWDEYNERLADELIDHYLRLEASLQLGIGTSP